MTANNLFEIFNHFLVKKDSDEISKLALDIQCFKSDRFGDGSFVYGAEAPSAFRLTLNDIMKSKTKYAVEVVSRAGNKNAAVYVVNVKSGSETSKSALSLGVAKNRLVYFVETKT